MESSDLTQSRGCERSLISLTKKSYVVGTDFSCTHKYHFFLLLGKIMLWPFGQPLSATLQEKSSLLDLFAMTISLIWDRRNQLRAGEKAIPVGMVCSAAMEKLNEFQLAAVLPKRASPPVSLPKWSPPPPGWVKVNFDGALFSSKNLAGLGAIIRNDKGHVMASYTQSIPLPTSVETVEVLAARNAASLTKDLNFEQVIFEGDAEVIIKAINSGGLSSSSFGHIIKDINLLTSAFLNVSFRHTRRTGNRVAHGLARMACNFSSLQVWMEDVPPDLLPVYLSDFPE